MENLEGGHWIDWACVGAGVAGVAATVFSGGAGITVGCCLVGAYCSGWAAGSLL